MDNAVGGKHVGGLHHGLFHGDEIARFCERNAGTVNGFYRTIFNVRSHYFLGDKMVSQHFFEHDRVLRQRFHRFVRNRLESVVGWRKRGKWAGALEARGQTRFRDQAVERAQRRCGGKGVCLRRTFTAFNRLQQTT